MELMFIPKTGQNKTFENYRIQGSNTIIKGEINFENIVFYFIGRDKGIVESLLKIFSHGYSVDGIENAKVTLIHALNGEESDVPGVIFFDSHFSFNERSRTAQDETPLLPVVIGPHNIQRQHFIMLWWVLLCDYCS